MASTTDIERRGLLVSAGGSMLMACLGGAFYFFTDSEAVLLDALFSLVNFAVGLITLRVAYLVKQPGNEQFHFGYAAYEPMLNLSKGLLIVFVSLFALMSAIEGILEGGRAVQGGLIVGYAVIASSGCFLIAGMQRRVARKTGSPLAAVDATNWMIDGALSAAVALAFLIVQALEGGALKSLALYADQIVVIALVLLSLPIPVSIIRSNWRQLLGRAPDEQRQAALRSKVEGVFGAAKGARPVLRVLESGRSLYLQVYVVLEPGTDVETFERADQLREQLGTVLIDEAPELALDVIFTRDERWCDATTGLRSADIG